MTGATDGRLSGEAHLAKPAGKLAERVERVRAFHRFYNSFMDLLNRDLVELSYSLTETRVLFALAEAEVSDVPTIRSTLDIDSGYLSRILTRFEREGLITRGRSSEDGRRQEVYVTDEGSSALAELDARASQIIVDMLSPLNSAEQRRLVEAMSTIQGLLDRPIVDEALRYRQS